MTVSVYLLHGYNPIWLCCEFGDCNVILDCLHVIVSYIFVSSCVNKSVSLEMRSIVRRMAVVIDMNCR